VREWGQDAAGDAGKPQGRTMEEGLGDGWNMVFGVSL
jgi:hypothetical protein